jgi:hypothetical protein
MTSDETGLADALSPVDLPEPPAPLPHGLAWTSRAIAVATVFLALTNAHAIRGWAYQLPPTDYSAPVVSAAESWFDAMDSIGLNRPVEAVHGWWQSVKDRRFAGQASAGTSESRSAEQ